MWKKIPINIKSVLSFQNADELDKKGPTTQME